MKILRISAKGFKNCADGFYMDFIAKSKKTSEDKEYELLEIDDELFVYNTVGIVGKNASGKTSALELLDWCYDILSSFRLSGKGAIIRACLWRSFFMRKAISISTASSWRIQRRWKTGRFLRTSSYSGNSTIKQG